MWRVYTLNHCQGVTTINDPVSLINKLSCNNAATHFALLVDLGHSAGINFAHLFYANSKSLKSLLGPSRKGGPFKFCTGFGFLSFSLFLVLRFQKIQSMFRVLVVFVVLGVKISENSVTFRQVVQPWTLHSVPRYCATHLNTKGGAVNFCLQKWECR